MSKFKFVGYQEHVETPKGFERLKIESTIDCGDQDPFAFVSQPELLSKWFYPIKAIDAKPSGKIEFVDSNLKGVCASADLGREITFLSTEFGEFSARVKGKLLKLTFHILTNNLDYSRSKIESQINLLKNLVQ